MPLSMSDHVESGRSNSRRDASRSSKPRHVKRLNFAPLILELDTVGQPSTLNRDLLLVDENVAHIPCTSRSDYVRKWIETHESNGCDFSDELSQSSLVLGRSTAAAAAITSVETSPIIGSSRKQRRKTRINRCVAVKGASNADCRENAEHSANCRTQAGPDRENSEKSEIHRTPPCTEQVVGNESSPVLGRRAFSRKRMRKRSRRVLENVLTSKRLKVHGEADVNANPITKSDKNLASDAGREVSSDHVEEDRNIQVKAALFSTGAKRDLEKFEIAFSSPEKLQERLSLQDSSSSNKDDPRIEMGTSDEEVDGECNETSSTQNDSDSDNLRNIIEDTDTQEAAKTSRPSAPNKSLVSSSRQLFTPSQLAISNLDETYCSEVEIMQAPSTHLSAMISEVTSLRENTQKTGNKSTQSDVIISSIITTPSKKSPDKSMFAHLLDSGKKRRRPKKGSMVAKLQSLVNAQISGLRIWHYRMKKNPHDAASVEFISVLVRGCTKQFGNQFLDGLVLEDRFNLLRGDGESIDIEEAENHNAQVSTRVSETRSARTTRRKITVMLVCDIVGTLKMTSMIVIKVYPPWNILDTDDLTLEASYISISDNCVVSDTLDEKNPREREKRVIREFHCPCIEEQRELPFCARKPTGEKPDVMERIFDF